jgi:hypothetical protein
MKIIIVVTFFLLVLVSESQTKQIPPSKEATFCNKVGENNSTGGTYKVKELQNCDFKITPLDSNLTVVEFKMSIVAKNNSLPLTEKIIKGNLIPEEYKTQILTETKNVFLEFIKAINSRGEFELIKPIAV